MAQGDPTCIEGSFSLTGCGTIWATDFGENGTEYVVDVGGATTTFGDSGAPSWRTSPFGSLALVEGSESGQAALASAVADGDALGRFRGSEQGPAPRGSVLVGRR